MSEHRKQTTAQFSRWSESYDRSILQWLVFSRAHRALIRKLRQRFGDRPAQLLDIGCGTGIFAAQLREAMPNIRTCGVDLVRGMIMKGAQRWRSIADHAIAIQGDSERLPFADASFDAITCANSFHHYPHQQIAVNEMRRVLKPGGRLLLIEGYRDAPWGWFIFDVCVTAIEKNVLHPSRKQFRDMFAAAGFGEVEQKVHRGAAPFVLNEAVVPLGSESIPAPHFPVAETAELWEPAATAALSR